MVLASFLAGCGTLQSGGCWGKDAFWPLDSERIGQAAHNAFFDPQTLVPLAGAAIFAIGDLDHRASDWAVKHNPIFGSDERARDASDDLRMALGVEAIVTALATPSGDEPEQWTYSKLKGFLVEFAAVRATDGATGFLKDATDRTRPDKSSEDSFPSGHTSSAFSYMTLANSNLDYIDLPGNVRPMLKIANTLVASGVAWARVEGRRHYPSDVLVGAALGHFLTAFIHDAFLNLPKDNNADLAFFPVEGGGGIQLCFRF